MRRKKAVSAQAIQKTNLGLREKGRGSPGEPNPKRPGTLQLRKGRFLPFRKKMGGRIRILLQRKKSPRGKKKEGGRGLGSGLAEKPLPFRPEEKNLGVEA